MTELEPIPPQPAMTPTQAIRLHGGDPKAHQVPKWLLEQVKTNPRNGLARDPMKIAWFFRVLETGD